MSLNTKISSHLMSTGNPRLSYMNIHYKIYLKQTLLLVSSLVIKSNHAISQMNTLTRLQGIEVDASLPRTWKYYMNLNGDHHQTDVPMYVTSQDTFEEIEFNKENLDNHLITKRSYKELGRFYKALVAKYPNQELLIKGILNPIPYSQSIDARDHKILGFDSSLIEPQEQFLIPELQDYIDGFFDKWYNVDYNRIESLYTTYMNAVLYSNLPMQIMLSRKRRCYTDLAHTYHIKMYLLSFSRKVGEEFNYLSKFQKLWLYRNIKYLTLNIGTSETLDEVVRNIMNSRGFPVVATELEFDYENMVENLNPNIKTYGVDLGYIKGESLNVTGVDDILGRQLIKAPLNPDYRSYDRERFEKKYLTNKFDKLTTKVLESNVVDRTDAEPFTFKSAVTNYWPFMAASGYYNSKISVTVPSTGDVHQLDMLEAFVLYVYTLTASDKVFLDRIPCIYIQRVLRLLPPRVSELERFRMNYTPKYFLEYISKEIPIVQRVISTLTFNEKIVEIHRVQNDLRTMRHFQGDYKIEGNLHQIIDRYFHSLEINPFNNQSYDTWFAEREIEIEQWIGADFIEVAGDIFKKATGIDIDRGSALKELHSSMVRIVDELTSYSVHMLTTVNDDSIKILDTKFPKGTVPESLEETSVDMDPNVPTILKVTGRLGHKIRTTLETPLLRNRRTLETNEAFIPVWLSTKATSTLKNDVVTHINIPTIVSIDKPVIIVDKSTHNGESTIEYDVLATHGSELDGILDIYDQLTPQRMSRFLGN